MTRPTPDLVFVYGTLKRGQKNHHLLATAEFIAPAFTEAKFRLIDCGPYPALIDDSPAPLAIGGDVFRIDASTLPELDRLEDEGRLYRRTVIEVTIVDGGACDQSLRTVAAWTYLWIADRTTLPVMDASSWPWPTATPRTPASDP